MSIVSNLMRGDFGGHENKPKVILTTGLGVGEFSSIFSDSNANCETGLKMQALEEVDELQENEVQKVDADQGIVCITQARSHQKLPESMSLGEAATDSEPSEESSLASSKMGKLTHSNVRLDNETIQNLSPIESDVANEQQDSDFRNSVLKGEDTRNAHESAVIPKDAQLLTASLRVGGASNRDNRKVTTDGLAIDPNANTRKFEGMKGELHLGDNHESQETAARLLSEASNSAQLANNPGSTVAEFGNEAQDKLFTGGMLSKFENNPEETSAIPASELVSFSTFSGGGEARKVMGAAGQKDLSGFITQLREVFTRHSSGVVDVALSDLELGDVRLKLTPNDTSIIVSLFSKNPENLDFLRLQLDDIRAAVQMLGYDTADFEFFHEHTDDSPEDDQAETFTASATGDEEVGAFGNAGTTVQASGVDIRI